MDQGPGRTLATIITDTAKAQNTDFLSSDFQISWADMVARISLAISTAVKVKLIPSSGTGFYINGGSAWVAGTVLTEDVALDTGRTWNLQTDNASGTTVTHLVVQEARYT